MFFFLTDASTYAHFLFNAFDTDHNGSVSFEVRRDATLIPLDTNLTLSINRNEPVIGNKSHLVHKATK